MPNFKPKKCFICGKEYTPTGHCSKYCPTCSALQYKERQKEGQYRYRERQGKPVHVGKGGSNKKFTASPCFKTGISNFHRLRKELYAEVTTCQLCGKDIANVGIYEKCVHHIDHDRTHNTPDNLIVVCKRCHQIHHDCIKALQGGATTIPKGSRNKCSEAHGSSFTG